MPWKNLKAELEEEFGAQQGHLDKVAIKDQRRVGSRALRFDTNVDDSYIPETPSQRTARKRKERAARSEGVKTGPNLNAQAQARHMAKMYELGLPHPGAAPQVARANKFIPNKKQRARIADKSISSEVLAILLGVSRVTAFRLRRELLTGKRR